jgi:hypothetical protein
MTPVKAIRARCLDCSGGSSKEVRECSFKECPLYEYRLGHKPTKKKLTPLKAVKAFCLSCCNGNRKEVSMCTAKNCPLHAYKNGKRPQGYKWSAEAFKSDYVVVEATFSANKAIGGDI